MNTEQIMALAEKWRRTRVCEWAVSDSYKALQAAIEALVQERDEYLNLCLKQAAENKALRDEHQQTIYANQCLVAALDRIHDVLNGVYVDDVAGIVNRALAANTPPV
jgi:archaellum component FlaF (FlaF/FlaG flagellin family)